MSKYSEYLKSQKQKSVNFYASMYEGLGFDEISNKYCELTKRVNDDETKILLNINLNQIFPTQYGYGLKVGKHNVVWLKKWQVINIADWFKTEATYGCVQVMLTKEYYNVKDSSFEYDITVGDCASDSDFEKANGYHSWEDMVEIAKIQQEGLADSPIRFKVN